MLVWQNPRRNHLLQRLDDAGYGRLEPDLEVVTLQAGQLLNAANSKIAWGYFPVSCMVSVGGTTAAGHYTPICEVGREGLVGLAQLLGSRLLPYSSTVLLAGQAYRIPMDTLMAEFNRRECFQEVALEHVQLCLIQIAQSAICLRRHSNEQKICKLLAQGADRATNNELEMTHQFIGNMLGLRREDVTQTARRLQDEKLIEYTRGRITILVREAIAARSCECYGLLKSEFEP